jgi:small-conductance mechanosensitive channel
MLLFEEVISPLGNIFAVLMALGIALVSYQLLFSIMKVWSRKTNNRIPEILNQKIYYPGLILFILIGFMLCQPFINPYFPTSIAESFRHFIYLLLVAASAFVIIRIIHAIGDILEIYFDNTQADNLRARKVHTQFQLIERVLSVVIIIVAIAVGVMSFDRIKEIGTIILGSAGIVSIIIGFAAQKSIGNFIAGLQIAITQPIRIDDVVIVENEWGRIEEISLTYIVVRIWDERAMILPINYFLEKPFQNWTRINADLLGTIMIYTDYSIPLEPLRKELTRLLENNNLWDKRVNLLQVTNATEKSMELRALVSAGSSSKLFDLRCDIREGLITFIQKNYTEALPKSRMEILKN